MLKRFNRFIRRYWFVIALSLLGAFIRLYRLEASLQFLGDQGRDVIVLRNIIVNHDLPFIGPTTSVGGFFLGPLYYYLMAPFLYFSNFNPIGPALATAMIGVLTIPAIYLVTKDMLSKSSAYYATLLYALGAVPSLETRGAWNPNPMPLAALGIVYGFYKSRIENNPKWLYLSAISLGVALQLHYMIVFLSPFILWQIILVLKNKKLKKYLIIWPAIVFIIMLPLVLFELKNNFINLKGLIDYLNKYDSSTISFWDQIRHIKGRSEQAIGMLLGFGESFTVLREWLTRLIWVPALYLLSKKPKAGYKAIIFWLFSTIVTITFFHGRIPPYYLGFIFPAVFMLTGYLLSLLKGNSRLIGAAFIIIFLSYNSKTAYNGLTQTGNLKSVQTTAKFIKEDIDKNNHQNYNLSLLDGTKDYKGYSFRYFLQVFGGTPLGIDQYPETNVLYVISPYVHDPQEVLDNPIWEIKSLRPAKVSHTWEFPTSENIYKIERL